MRKRGLISLTCIFLLLIILSTISISKVEAKLVASYAFNENSGNTVLDNSSMGNNGVLSGATRTASGKYGRAVVFNGVSNMINVSDSNSLDFSNGMTLEAWVYPTSIPRGWRTIIAKDSVNDLSYSLYASSKPNNKPSQQVNVNGEQTLQGVSQLSVNTWTFLAATYDGNIQRLYINGVEVSNRSQTGLMNISNGQLHFGGNSLYGEYFAGRIDEVRIYNNSLSPIEILSDMNTPVGNISVDVIAPSVSITSPINGSLVSGTINITASASDNFGVVGVQFLLDGNNLSSEDITPPYYVSWNSSTVNNGIHVLSARARDAAGNTNQSSISVNVSNVPPQPSQTSLTFDKTSPQVYGNSITPTCSIIIGMGNPVLQMNGNTIISGQSLALGAGVYSFNCSLASSQNYTTSSTTMIFAISQSSVALSLSGSPSWNVTNPMQTTVTGNWCASGLMCNLYRNDVLVTNPDVQTLTAGTYNYIYNTTGNQNYSSYSATNILIVNSPIIIQPQPSQTLLTFDKVSPQVYGNSITPTCSIIIGVGNPVLQMNGNTIISGQSLILGAGNYLFNCSYAGNTNYTASSNSSVFTISQSNSQTSLTFDKTSPQVYGNSITPTCSIITGGNEALALTNGISGVAETLGTGSWTINCSYAGNTNYTASSNSSAFTISQNSIVLTLSAVPSWNVTNPTQTTVTGNGCANNLVCNLYRNDILVSNPDTQTLAAGTYSYIYNTTGNQNYSYYSATNILIVNSPVVNNTPLNISGYYFTNFPLNESPISENGSWTNGKTDGIDWYNIVTTPGLAIGQDSPQAYSDPTAILKGTWNANQSAEAVVYTVNQNSNYYQEVELRLRSRILAHNNTGYEINFRATNDGSQYVQIVRWNGALGDFTYITSTSGPGLYSGDVVKATIVGNVITAYINGVQVAQGTDNTFKDGNPGIGFDYGCQKTYSDFGFTNFTASDIIPLIINNTVPQPSQTSLTFDKTSPQIYGNSITPTCSVVIGVGNPVLQMNGNTIFSGQSLTLGAGNYLFNCSYAGNANYTTSSNVSTFTINPASVTLSLSSSPSWNVTNPAQTTVIGNGCINGLMCNLYRNDILVTNPDIQTLTAGTYNYIYNTTGNQNYSFYSVANTLVVNSPIVIQPQSSQTSLTFDKTSPQVYGNSITPTCSVVIGVGNPILQMNGNIITSGQSLNLGGGNYLFNCSLASSQNYTASSTTAMFTINQAPIILSLSSSPSWNVTNPTQTTITGSGCVGGLVCNLYRNDILVSNPDMQTLTAGTYNYIYNTTGNQNYSSYSVANTLTVNSPVVNNTLPGNINFTFPTPSDGTIQTAKSVYVNVSTSYANNNSAWIDWNRSLVGYWAMDSYNASGIYDNSTYGNFGSFNGGLGIGNIVTGARGKALQFDGINDYLNMGNVAGANGVKAITVSVWIKSSSSQTSETHFVDKSACDGQTNHGVFELGVSIFTSRKAEFVVYPLNGAPSPYIASGSGITNIDDKNWHYVVGQYNGSVLSIWVDGIKENSKNVGLFNLSSNTYVLESGGHCNNNPYWFNGTIDELMIWNRALSPQEINASYNAGIYKLYNNFTNLSNGNYNYTAYTIDAAGNASKTETRSITISP